MDVFFPSLFILLPLFNLSGCFGSSIPFSIFVGQATYLVMYAGDGIRSRDLQIMSLAPCLEDWRSSQAELPRHVGAN